MEKTIHTTNPPPAPSIVFLGLKCGTSLCLPKRIPEKYAPLTVIHANKNGSNVAATENSLRITAKEENATENTILAKPSIYTF